MQLCAQSCFAWQSYFAQVLRLLVHRHEGSWRFIDINDVFW
jgi:hypothetical protein